MQPQEIEQDGRKYKAYVSDDQGAYVVIGPAEGLVDSFGAAEPFATKLHNILYNRGLFNYEAAAQKNALIGALQEAYGQTKTKAVILSEAQKLLEQFSKYEQETVY